MRALTPGQSCLARAACFASEKSTSGLRPVPSNISTNSRAWCVPWCSACRGAVRAVVQCVQWSSACSGAVDSTKEARP